MYCAERESNSPQSPETQSPEPTVPAPPPPKPPKLVQKFWLKRAFMRPLTSIFLDGLADTSNSSSVPWPLSP